ncbi:telomere repeats-binding bouquet formation protein 2-like isoform X1 [Argopecten irradians]|uniref:telomere repeats-binding bouquet formation protein 2-like isoform X1 n=1 Tax=Argopecten irradians TaxID=31199 RepID=UPI00371460B7
MHGTGDAGTSQLFQGQTAWFSSSVSSRNIKLWKEHGGLIVGIEHAQFVFSEDEEAEDTKQIFSSEAYIDEHLAVFHAKYVSDAVKQSDGTKIPLGDYFLPPKDIQQFIKKQMKFKWDKESESNKDDDSTPDKEGDENEDQVMENCSRHSNIIQFDGEDYVDIQGLAKISGPITNFIPGENGCEIRLKNKKTKPRM